MVQRKSKNIDVKLISWVFFAFNVSTRSATRHNTSYGNKVSTNQFKYDLFYMSENGKNGGKIEDKEGRFQEAKYVEAEKSFKLFVPCCLMDKVS